ncbi:hypothetical protein L6452_15254 [Arctium lappa]|uniref:Uncharacterized protein n=1 Tax=Arctium lappa TaxID=4217 RepID=A0ACB9CN30_ARCLA|nr:hypothetical protein L6452_15254 [Arctium lappa]
MIAGERRWDTRSTPIDEQAKEHNVEQNGVANNERGGGTISSPVDVNERQNEGSKSTGGASNPKSTPPTKQLPPLVPMVDKAIAGAKPLKRFLKNANRGPGVINDGGKKGGGYINKSTKQ